MNAKAMSAEDKKKIQDAKKYVMDTIGPTKIAELQASIDEMKQTGQFRQYVSQRKLELIFGKDGRMLDNMLYLGILH